MIKRTRIAVDCCGEILRIIWPLKADFPCQSEGISKQYTEEAFILTQDGLVFVFNHNEIRMSGVFELVSCNRVGPKF